MIKVRDLMTADVVALSPNLTLRDALALLDANRISGAPVVAGGDVVGVLSATDILAFEATTPGVPAAGLESEGYETEAAEWEEGGEPPGAYFTEWWADAGAELVERFREVSGPEWDFLEEHTAEEAMTRGVWAIQPDASVQEASALMVRAGVHRLLVMESGRLAGIITTMDIVGAVAERGL